MFLAMLDGSLFHACMSNGFAHAKVLYIMCVRIDLIWVHCIKPARFWIGDVLWTVVLYIIPQIRKILMLKIIGSRILCCSIFVVWSIRNLICREKIYTLQVKLLQLTSTTKLFLPLKFSWFSVYLATWTWTTINIPLSI